MENVGSIRALEGGGPYDILINGANVAFFLRMPTPIAHCITHFPSTQLSAGTTKTVPIALLSRRQRCLLLVYAHINCTLFHTSHPHNLPCRYNRNGPYDVLIDGANVAFYGQNREGGGFNWSQIISMVKLVKQKFPDKKVLLVSCG